MARPAEVLDLTQMSASRLEATRCLYRWSLQYIHGRREPDSEATIVGKAVHEALEHTVNWVQQQIKEQEAVKAGTVKRPKVIEFPGPRTAAVGAIVEAFVKVAQEDAAAAGIDLNKTTVEEIGRMARKAIGILQGLDPAKVRVEYEFSVPLPPGVRRPGTFRGFMDLLVIDGERGRIIDVKTGRTPYDVTEDEKLQLLLYASAAEQLFPEVKEWTLELHFVRLGVVATHVYTEEDRARAEAYLVEKANRIFDAIGADFFPAQAGKQCNHCPVAQSCPLALSMVNEEEPLTKEEAEELFGVYLATERRLNQMKQRLQKAVQMYGPLSVGGEYLADYPVASQVWPNIEELEQVLNGLGLNIRDYMKLDETKLRRLAEKQPAVLALAEIKYGKRFEHRSEPPAVEF